MKALIPRIFRTGGIVDGEDVNENLRSLARDIKRNNDRRYTYCTVSIPLDGMVDTDTEAERQVYFGVPNLLQAEVVAVELSIYAAGTEVWTLSVLDSDGRTETLTATSAGATTEAYDSSSMPLQFSSTCVLTMSAPAASTITRGSITLSLRCDRQVNDGNSRLDYEPAFVDATTSTAGSVLDTQLQAAQLAVESDDANDWDIRVECYLARNFSTVQTWRSPSGNGRGEAAVNCFAVGTAADEVDFADGYAGGFAANIVCSGTSAVDAAATEYWTAANGDPTDSGDDSIFTMTPTTGTAISVAYMFVWWR